MTDQRLSIFWSMSELARLVELNDQGLSSTQIAAVLPGRSRNSVIGQLHRSGIASKYAKPKRKGPPRNKNPRPRGIKPLELRVEIPVEVIDIERSEGKELFDLRNQDCRWPYGKEDYYFCGKPKLKKSSYCVGHSMMSKRKDTYVWRRP